MLLSWFSTNIRFKGVSTMITMITMIKSRKDQTLHCSGIGCGEEWSSMNFPRWGPLSNHFVLLFQSHHTDLTLNFQLPPSPAYQLRLELLHSSETFCIFINKGRPSQLVELSRSEFDPELFSHSAFFCDIRNNILRQNETILYTGNGERGRK